MKYKLSKDKIKNKHSLDSSTQANKYQNKKMSKTTKKKQNCINYINK